MTFTHNQQFNLFLCGKSTLNRFYTQKLKCSVKYILTFVKNYGLLTAKYHNLSFLREKTYFKLTFRLKKKLVTVMP